MSVWLVLDESKLYIHNTIGDLALANINRETDYHA